MAAKLGDAAAATGAVAALEETGAVAVVGAAVAALVVPVVFAATGALPVSAEAVAPVETVLVELLTVEEPFVLVELLAAAALAATSATVGAFVCAYGDQFEEPHPVENRAVKTAATNRHRDLFPIAGKQECTTASLALRITKNCRLCCEGRPNTYIWDWAYLDELAFLILLTGEKMERSQKYMFYPIPYSEWACPIATHSPVRC